MAAALGACYSTNPTGGAVAAWVQNLGSIAIVDVDNGTPACDGRRALGGHPSSAGVARASPVPAQMWAG